MTPSLDLPPTPNTAPVLEFRCLYTPDLRRKQKRWQDGRLKFHAFNKRVMVYDERSNFVGDTHWRDGADFDEGEELELERGGILVQVGEFVGRRDQDLFELVEKRVKERKDRAAAKNATRSPSGSPGFAGLRDITPLRGSHPGPKPLNAVIGTPTGHYGRAMMPTISAFEERYRLKLGIEVGNENHESAKRRKHNNLEPKNSYAQNLMGARLTLSARKPQITATVRHEKMCEPPPLKRLRVESIDLTKDGDIVGDDLPRSRTALREKLVPAQVTTNIERRKTIYSTEEGGHSSKLIGPPLTLFAPRVLVSGCVSKGDGDEDQCQAKMTAADGDHTERANMPEMVTPTISVEQGEDFPSKKVKSLMTLRRTSRHPSPLVGDGGAVVAENAESCHIITPVTIPKKSVSTLRIKARPPPKMMMLMERANSRSEGSIDTSNISKFTPKKTRKMAPTPDSLGASHATLQSNVGFQGKAKSLREHLKAKQLDTDQEEAVTPVAEINEQTNDAHFGRAKSLAENAKFVMHNAASPNPLRRKSASSFEACPGELRQSAVAKTPSPLTNSTPAALDLYLDVPLAPINEMTTPVSNASTLLRQVDVASNGREVLDDQLSFAKTSPPQRCKSVHGVSAAVLPHRHTPPSASDTISIKKTNLDLRWTDVISKYAIAAPVTRVAVLGRSLCNSTPLVAQEINSLDAAEQMQEPPHSTRILRHPNIATPSSGIEVMPSPKLSPALVKTSTSQPPSKEWPYASVVTLPSPVRRGTPVQEISAVMGPSTSVTPPPPRNTPAACDAPKTTSPRGPTDIIATGGPWSRESFDLFGEWRPT